jgi:hypothetical protein
MTKVELVQPGRFPARSDHYENVRLYRNEKNVFGDPSQCEVGPDASLIVEGQNAREKAELNEVIQTNLDHAESLLPEIRSKNDL